MLTYRPRRNRKSQNIRDMLAQTQLRIEDFIAPLFFCEGSNIKQPIEAMPDQYRYSLDLLVKKVNELYNLGVRAIALFPAIDESLKSSSAKEAINPNGLNQRAIKLLKDAHSDLVIMTDVALDPYNSDGHDGLVDTKTGEILNDETLDILSQMALIQAQAGSDIIGPSDMMDGRVSHIRNILDENSFKNVSIMSYTAKYASAFYGPFRSALDSAPKSGDKKSYQMDYRNKTEAIRELTLDENEGADIVMVKPALSYLDIISDFRHNTTLPVAAYNVSGEYAMIKASAQRGWIDEQAVMLEVLTSIKRAGADIILSYFAQDLAKLIRQA